VEDLLVRAGKGPDRRIAARTRAAAAMPLRPDEEDSPSAPPAGPGTDAHEEQELGQVIPFGVFDAFTDGSR